MFNNEAITENFFKGHISKIQMTIRIRDYNEGRAGKITRHKNSPSIKIIDYAKGKTRNHSKDGDPVYFNILNGELLITFDKKQFNSKEIKYIKNFIEHNCLNLNNYWYAPDYIKNFNELDNYQNLIKDRILHNIKVYDYSKNIGVIDDEIKY